MTNNLRAEKSRDEIDLRWLTSAQHMLGHHFADQTLLVSAFTHASRAGPKSSYERLEFLGDRVLGLVLTDYLVNHFPHADQG